MSGTWSQASINEDMASFIGKYVRDIPATSSGTVTTHIISSATTKCSWALWYIKTVKMRYIVSHGHIVLWLTMIQVQQSLTLRWRSLSGWGREHVGFSFSIKAANNLFMTVYNLLPSRLPKIHNQQSLTLRWRSFSTWGREGIAVCLLTKVATNSSMTVCNLLAV